MAPARTLGVQKARLIFSKDKEWPVDTETRALWIPEAHIIYPSPVKPGSNKDCKAKSLQSARLLFAL